MSSTMEANESSVEPEDPKPEDSVDVEKPKVEFRLDVAAIESVSKDQQASELQNLELDVFDHAILEKGIIAQVNQAIHQVDAEKEDLSGTREDGALDEEEEEDEFSRRIRLGEVTPFDKSQEGEALQKKSRDGFNEALQRYMETQAKLQKNLKKKSSETPKKSKPSISPPKRKSKPKEFIPEVEEAKKRRQSQKSKKQSKKHFLGTKPSKKTAKEKLGSRKTRGKVTSEAASQPGEEHTLDFDAGSGSEYVPTGSEDSEVESAKPRRAPNKALAKLTAHVSDEDTSDWESSEDETGSTRRSNKELDDGDPHYFTKRVKSINRLQFTADLHTVLDEFKCPKVVWDKLYKYQQVAVKWFWELNQQRCGGILGDEMGLGKTIQVIAFLSGLYVSDIMDYDTGFSGLGPTLIVCPTTVMHQWVREFHKWFPIIRVAILHESGTFSNTGKERSRLIDSIHSHDYGVVITSYNGLVQHSKKMLEKQWHYVILDEGHKIRNSQAQVTVVAKQLETPHRIILSGSPLQNNLKELWSLFDFIYPGKLGTLQVFTNVFHIPIVAGGYTNASPTQVMQAFKCALMLKDTITPYLLRRMKKDVDAHIKLPPKTEQVLFCKLSDEQRKMYLHYLGSVNLEDFVRGHARVFVGLINLRKICNHPDLYSGGPRNDFTLMLLILEDFVKRCGYQYLKLDGSTSISARQPLIDKFNKDNSYFVMLLTTKVGGLGVNLTGANRVVIYDPDWNPATDTQARERAWRIGQERDVTVYRLVTAGTIEEKIYHRQIFKQFLSNKVLKDPKQRRFFKSNDLSELFTLSETVKDGTNETAAIFAGTGSEVKLSKLSPKKKPLPSVKDEAQDPKITFSDAKIEQMKKMAQLLSQKFASKEADKQKVASQPSCSKSGKPDNATKTDSPERINPADLYGPDGQIKVESVKKIQNGENQNKTGENDNRAADESGDSLLRKRLMADKNDESPKKKHKRKSSGTFEGHEVPHLVKCKKVKKRRDSEEKDESCKSQDDYVLAKLFSKSGIETALRHDTIMEGGPNDYAIIEAEADKVAQEAIKALKKSSADVPVVRKPMFKPTAQGSALLDAIKRRNLVVDASDSENSLVNSLLTWLCSKGGVASTDTIIGEFSSKVGPGKSPVFKSLLSKIASFHRGADKIGYWTVKDEFKFPNLTTPSNA